MYNEAGLLGVLGLGGMGGGVSLSMALMVPAM
jgi:hypothetical protein